MIYRLIDKAPVYADPHLHAGIRISGRYNIVPGELSGGWIEGIQVLESQVGGKSLYPEVKVGGQFGDLHFNGTIVLIEKLSNDWRIPVCLIRCVIAEFDSKTGKQVFKTKIAIISHLVT